MADGRRRLTFWIGVVLGVGLFGFLLIRYDPERVLLPLLESRLHLLAAVVLLQLGIQVLNALTPAALLGPPPGHQLSRWRRTRVFLALQPIAVLAPGRLSDFGALLALKRHYPSGAVASAIVVDKLVTLFLLLLLTPVALRLVWPRNAGTAVDLAALAAVLVVGILPFLLVNRRFRSLVNRYVLRAWPSLLEGFGAHTEALLRASKARLGVNFVLTVLKLILAGLALSLLARNFDVALSFWIALWMSVLIQLATSLPIAPQGLGIAEGSLVLLFGVNGFPEAAAMSVGVTGRVLFIPVMATVYLAATLPTISDRIGTNAAPGEVGAAGKGRGRGGPGGGT